MDAIIVLVVSVIGNLVCGIDFFALHTFLSVSLGIYKEWINYTNDKATRR